MDGKDCIACCFGNFFLTECQTLFDEQDKVGSCLSSSHEDFGMDSFSPDVKSVIR